MFAASNLEENISVTTFGQKRRYPSLYPRDKVESPPAEAGLGRGHRVGAGTH